MFGLCLLLVINLFVMVRGDPQEFRSAPTTVKAQENNTVLLPCYLETTNNGLFVFVVRRRFKKNTTIIPFSTVHYILIANT